MGFISYCAKAEVCLKGILSNLAKHELSDTYNDDDQERHYTYLKGIYSTVT